MRRAFPIFALVATLVAATPPTPAADAKELKAKYEGQSFTLQHNLYFEDNEAEWQNFIDGDFVPLGSKVTVKKIDSAKAVLGFEDPPLTIKLDIAGANPDAAAVLARMLGSTTPSLKGFGKKDLEAIKYAVIREGMTRKAMFLAVGYPPYSYTPPFRKDSAVNHDPMADELTYMRGTYDFLKITLSGDKVVDVED